MFERDRGVAAYRDAVLSSGVLTVLTPSETETVLDLVARSWVSAILCLGVFLIEGTRGSVLAIPRTALKEVASELREAGLKNAERRLRRAAARQAR